MQQDNFTPWHVDYWFSVIWLTVSFVGGWGLFLCGHGWMAAALSFWLTGKGWACFSKGLARERGIEVERRAFRDFLFSMPVGEYFVAQDIAMTNGRIHYGNVDMVVSPVRTQASFVVEIKSYSGIIVRWFGLCREHKFYRLWSPQKQVRRQCKYLGKQWHFPVLWLPESKLYSWIIHDGILVVNGDAKLLMYALRVFEERVRLPVTVSFPYAPGSGYTGFLRGKGFTYNGDSYIWMGRQSRGEADVLAMALKDVGGRVCWVGR